MTVTRPPGPPWSSVPTELLWPILEKWMDENKQERFAGDEHGGVIALARRAGVDAESIRRIPKQPWVRFDKADRLLCAIGRPDAWSLELGDLGERLLRESETRYPETISGEKAA